MGVAKRWIQLLVLLTLVLSAGYAWQEHRANAAQAAAYELATRGQMQLTKSLTARLGSTTLERDSLSALVTGAKLLHGKLVAGVTITVEKHDTTIVHDTLVTQVAADSSRTANFRDSTFAGVVSGTVTAPPCCSALRLSLSVSRPEFRPQVGFVEVDGHLAAEVNWQGEHVHLDNVYGIPVAKQPSRITPWVEGSYGLLANSELRAGIELRLFGLRAGPSIQQSLIAGRAPEALLTIRKEW